MTDHDKTHKLFFTHRRFVRDFFLGFLPREWIERMDLDTLEPVQASLVGRDLSERHGDRVWRVRWSSSETAAGWFYFYLLIEFQSTPHPWMALRLHNYVGHLLEDITRKRRNTDRRLPPVVPLILYDGSRPWTAPLDLGSLFVPVPESVRRHLPQLQPLFLDESRLSSPPPNNLATVFFQLNTSRSPAALPDLTRELIIRLPRAEEAELRRDFVQLILRTLRQSFPGVTIPEVAELEDLPVFGQRLIEWRDQGLNASRAEGLAKGRKEGEVEGRRALLLRLLKKRFGPLPRSVRQEVLRIASARKLDILAERVLVAASLEEMGFAVE